YPAARRPPRQRLRSSRPVFKGDRRVASLQLHPPVARARAALRVRQNHKSEFVRAPAAAITELIPDGHSAIEGAGELPGSFGCLRRSNGTAAARKDVDSEYAACLAVARHATGPAIGPARQFERQRVL